LIKIKKGNLKKVWVPREEVIEENLQPPKNNTKNLKTPRNPTVEIDLVVQTDESFEKYEKKEKSHQSTFIMNKIKKDLNQMQKHPPFGSSNLRFEEKKELLIDQNMGPGKYNYND
jgi:hypothetical protein